MITLHVKHHTPRISIPVTHLQEELFKVIALELWLQKQNDRNLPSISEVAKAIHSTFQIASSKSKEKAISLKTCRLKLSEYLNELEENSGSFLP